MSYAIIRNTNYKLKNLAGIYRHNERKNTNYSNKDIHRDISYKNYSIKKPITTYEKAFKQLNDVQKYYFCAAFSMGAMSVSKPETASAMVNYFLGLGVVKYGQGIDDMTYPAFDSGKHIFRYELVVNDILDKKICENIIVEATGFAKDNNISAETLNDKGKEEVEKIVKKLK